MSDVVAQIRALYESHPVPMQAADEIERLRQVIQNLMTNPHLDLGDLVYNVRERECQGWEGPSVKAWSDAVTAARLALSTGKEADERLQRNV